MAEPATADTPATNAAGARTSTAIAVPTELASPSEPVAVAPVA